jgi:hypothetical protein
MRLNDTPRTCETVIELTEADIGSQLTDLCAIWNLSVRHSIRRRERDNRVEEYVTSRR